MLVVSLERAQLSEAQQSTVSSKWPIAQGPQLVRLLGDLQPVLPDGDSELDSNWRVLFIHDAHQEKGHVVLRVFLVAFRVDEQTPADLVVGTGEENWRVESLASLLRQKRKFLNDAIKVEFHDLLLIGTASVFHRPAIGQKGEIKIRRKFYDLMGNYLATLVIQLRPISKIKWPMIFTSITLLLSPLNS